MPNTFQGAAGGHIVNITPPRPMKGYGDSVFRRGEEGTDLLSQAVVITDGDDISAVVSLDVTAIGRSTVLAIRELCELRTGIPARNVCVASNHNHNSPHAAGMFLNGVPPDPLYIDFLITQAVQSIVEAKRKLRPARYVAGNARAPGFEFNRRLKRPDGTVVLIYAPNADPSFPPTGPVDKEVGYVFFEDENRDPISCVFSYTIHNVLGGTDTFHRDLGGRIGDVLRRRLGVTDLATSFLAGACGNIMRFREPGLKGSGPDVAWRIGEGVADSILESHGENSPQEIRDLRFASEVLEIPDRSLEESEFCEDNCRGTDSAALKKARDRYGPEMIALQDRGPTSCLVEIGAISMGDVAIATNPAELFVEYGLEIKQKSPFEVTMISELTNGYCGYVPTEEAFAMKGYETHRTVFTSRLAKNGGQIIADKSVEMLQRCKTAT